MQQLRPNEKPPGLAEAVRAYLLKREYPGNVRDLQQLVTRISYRHVGPGVITVGDIPEEERPSVEFRLGHWRNTALEHAIRDALALGIRLKEIGRAAEDIAERIALHMEDGNLRRAANRLGITDRALQLRRAARRQREQAQHNDLIY
jgi:transcriptional regulator with PAS, ATPase and Fis domain